MNTEQIGKRVREARKTLGLTQEQLAVDIHISESYMALIETGKRNMSIDILCKLSQRLGVTADYLLTGLEEKSEKLTREFVQITHGRCEAENRAALNLLRDFFTSLDSARKS